MQPAAAGTDDVKINAVRWPALRIAVGPRYGCDNRNSSGRQALTGAAFENASLAWNPRFLKF
jgi:hypothetical protein